ncbi:ATP-dependent RNA helicase HrpA [Rugosimonospora acidiphila]|uniref:ATP-dependent RNA helicase HrpA n=1 Tax=Rugosimonospora acidiphila TaxID=556531 RepID=A0ABP9RQM8_9ACTN
MTNPRTDPSARLDRRRAAVPGITYPEALPVSQKKDDILAAIRDHQVVIVAGETGSGKTTQLPKICLELGRGINGMIGHTQPRRLAARTVAERIAQELDTQLGGAIGYQVRFTGKVGDDTLVKVMTDGILLAEIQRDRQLRRYDTLIIDEAHERSLNIDFILGYLKRLLPRRPDLKVIITSATIDPERFARHFGGEAAVVAAADGPAEAGPGGGSGSGGSGSGGSGSGGSGGGSGPGDGSGSGGPGGGSGGPGSGGSGAGQVPIIEVSGRTFPVEVRYRPIIDDSPESDEFDDETDADTGTGTGPPARGGARTGGPGGGGGGGAARGDRDDRDQTQAILDAVDELCAEGPGDILVFLSGEREIRDTAEALRRRELPLTEVLPLYARLSAAEQHRVFGAHTGRRIVLATNVAETSLTVPGIKYVIDPGTARISRYSYRTKVQRLPIEPISQASANQRKGRCGRTSDGICIRLYSEADFLSRPEFTDPEILRTNLASVILQATAIGLGDVAGFPFIDPPDRRNIADGLALLAELGALADGRLTGIGRKLARLPIDPRLGRMILAAERNGCVREVLIIAAALSIQDPRERPVEHRQAADQLHARFADPESDFQAYLNLWNYLREQQQDRSSNQFRRLCRTEFLNYLRVREWQDLDSQLRQVVKDMGVTLSSAPEESVRIHQSLLPGLLSHLGLKDPETREYVGARNAKFAIFPGSALFKKQPRWVMAAELVETSRLWARMVARVDPQWIEEHAGHLVRRNYSEPHWERKQAAVLAYERVTLYGLPIVVGRKVNFGRVDPTLSRELFIRHALVEGDWDTHHRFFHENRELREDVEDLEHRARRRDILVDDEALFEFYDRRIPADVVSGRHFDTWWKKARHEQPNLLSFSESMLVNETASTVDPRDYPDAWRQDGLEIPLTYQFEPGSGADGVTAHLPLAALNQVRADAFGWQVPGLREELVTALIRGLPKPIRREFAPAPDHARAALAGLTPYVEPLLDGLERELHRLTGVVVPREAWQLDRVPDHLKLTFRVVDEHGKAVAEGKDLAALKRQLRGRIQAALADAAGDIERTGLRDWTIGTLPRIFAQQRGGYPVKAYPALRDEGDSVAVRLFDTEDEAAYAMWRGTRRLLTLTVPAPVKALQGRLSNEAKLALSRNPHGSVTALMDDCVAAAMDALIAEAGGPAWDADGYAALRERVRAGLGRTLVEVVERVGPVLTAAHEVSRRLAGTNNLLLVASLTDLREQLAALVFPGFVEATGAQRLADLPRYLTGIQRRLDRLTGSPARDRERMGSVQQLEREYRQLLAQVPPGHPVPDGLRQVRWMLEELRVNYFAQALGTPYPISDKRVLRALDDLTA